LDSVLISAFPRLDKLNLDGMFTATVESERASLHTRKRTTILDFDFLLASSSFDISLGFVKAWLVFPYFCSLDILGLGHRLGKTELA
jgi:hypothetical protein